MRNIYSIITLLILFFSGSIIGQERIFAPDLRAPEDGQTHQYPNVLLDWDAVTGQTTQITYEVQIATKEDFSDATTFAKTPVTALQMADLPFGQNYYWRVKAFDTDEPSEWSETWKFQIVVTVSMTKPSNGSMEYADPLIEWDSINGLLKYEMEVDTVHDWMMESTGNTETVNGTYVVSKTNMWSVGTGGTILNFDGTEWTTSESGVSDDLASVYFVDENNGYAVGKGGTVLHYDGSAWTKVDVGTTEDLTGISFVDANMGWTVGNGGVIVKYDNGTWSSVTSGVSSDLYGVYALSASDVWACGKAKMVLHFNGTEWSSSEEGTKDHNSVWFVDASNGWIVGKLGEILYYDGSEWVVQESGTSKDLYGVSFAGEEGYAVGKSGTMLFYNGAWSSSASGTEEAMNGIWLADGTGLSGGEEGEMIVETGQGFTSPYAHIINVPYDSASWNLDALLFGKISYYRMRAVHSGGNSAWSGGKSLETYAAPDLRSPKNNSTDSDLTILYRWDEYSGTNDYFFEISDNEEFTEAFMVVIDSTSTEYTVKKFGQDFFWRVRTSHALDVSDWSEVWKLTTAGTVELESPANGATDVPSCPRYVWEEITGTPQYEIMISKDPDFTNAEGQFTDASFFQCNQPLDKLTTYYWKVRGITTIDSSDWSEVRDFETEGYQSIEDEFTNNSVDIYPNPATSNVSVSIYSLAKDDYELSIVDMTGKPIYAQPINCNAGDNELKIGLADFQKGVYFVTIRKGEKVVTKKLFIR